MKTITIVITDLTGRGGVERATSLVAKQFLENDYKVTILSLFKNRAKPYINFSKDIKIKYITKYKYEMPSSIFKRLILIGSALYKFMRFKNPIRNNIIICQAFLPALVVYLSGLAKCSIVCEHFNYSLYSNVVTKLRNRVYAKFRGVVTLTKGDYISYSIVGIKAYTIPNIAPFKSIENEGFNAKKLISIGRLDRIKGFDLLLESLVEVFKKHPDWSLDLYGDGEEYKSLHEQAISLGIIDNVKFKGFTNNIAKQLKTSTIMILSSRSEGFPMVLLEAMACGCPIISFNCSPGVSEVLSNKCGILVPPLDRQELSNAINLMIESPELRTELTFNGYKAIKRFSGEEVFKSWKSIINELY